MVFSMRRFFGSSLFFWLIITIGGAFFLVHLHRFINFGIDLVGGTLINLEVQLDKAYEMELADRAQVLTKRCAKDGLVAPIAQKVFADHAEVIFANEADALALEQRLAEDTQRVEYTRIGATMSVSLTEQERNHIARDAVVSNIGVLRTRLDKIGVGELMIAAKGDRNIIIELPNVQDPQQAKAMIGKPAMLEIKLVESAGGSKEELLKKYNGTLPDDLIIVPGKERGQESSFYVVPRFTDLTGRLLKDAAMGFGGHMGTEPVVHFTFNDEGGAKFYTMTSSNIGRRAAVIIDGVVITAPNISSAISTNGEITGRFTAQEAQNLALLLKSGAFVAPVSFVEERHIEATLGQQSIRQGLMSCLIGFLILLVFSILVYKTAGLLAFLVLMYNLLLILFGLAWIGATLTLPGIAGMILTIGMAIDASILIYERIREELAIGSPLRKAVNTGFTQARTVILDSNMTHLIVAIILYTLGVGPIKGFAITIIIGIISTLITGLILLRSIFNFLLDVVGVTKMRF
jgi:preprotein translocase subunit SecD